MIIGFQMAQPYRMLFADGVVEGAAASAAAEAAEFYC